MSDIRVVIYCASESVLGILNVVRFQCRLASYYPYAEAVYLQYSSTILGGGGGIAPTGCCIYAYSIRRFWHAARLHIAKAMGGAMSFAAIGCLSRQQLIRATG